MMLMLVCIFREVEEIGLKLIKEIFNSDVGIESKKTDNNYFLRRAARAVILNKNKEIALLNVKRDSYHKLPGGGIEDKESPVMAIKRESMEEIGFTIKILSEVGLIIEYADNTDFAQISYCYLGEILEECNKSLSENEVQEMIELEWYSFDDAIEILKNNQPRTYDGEFIRHRDLNFVEEAYEVLKKISMA